MDYLDFIVCLLLIWNLSDLVEALCKSMKNEHSLNFISKVLEHCPEQVKTILFQELIDNFSKKETEGDNSKENDENEKHEEECEDEEDEEENDEAEDEEETQKEQAEPERAEASF